VFVSDLGGGGWDVSAYISTDRWYDGHLHISQYSRHVFGHDSEPRARVIGGGVDASKFSPDPKVVRDGGVLFVGRLLPHKGIFDLMAALPKSLPLTVVGPRPNQIIGQSLAVAAEGKTVTFKYGLDDAALVHEYRRARCVVLPSVYRTPDGQVTTVPELLGQTLLEGMACEAPVLCTQVASMPEVVEDGVSGFVVRPNDPAALADRLSWFFANPDAARRMGAAGRKRVLEHFTWPAVANRCLDAYRDALSRRLILAEPVVEQSRHAPLR
jgi:glycosyltransferase involved in cell wall biosynthesis